jgi:hypothetical protein
LVTSARYGSLGISDFALSGFGVSEAAVDAGAAPCVQAAPLISIADDQNASRFLKDISELYCPEIAGVTRFVMVATPRSPSAS